MENVNIITSTTPFTLNSTSYKIGKVGDGFRTALQGVLTVREGETPPPTGFFSGYAVGFNHHRF